MAKKLVVGISSSEGGGSEWLAVGVLPTSCRLKKWKSTSELETYTLWLLAWDSRDGITEGLPFLTPLCMPRIGCMISLGERNRKGEECDLMSGSSRVVSARPIRCQVGGPRKSGLARSQVGVEWCLAAHDKWTHWHLGLDFQNK